MDDSHPLGTRSMGQPASRSIDGPVVRISRLAREKRWEMRVAFPNGGWAAQWFATRDEAEAAADQEDRKGVV